MLNGNNNGEPESKCTGVCLGGVGVRLDGAVGDESCFLAVGFVFQLLARRW